MIKNFKLNKKKFMKLINQPCICTSYHGKLYLTKKNWIAKIYYPKFYNKELDTYDLEKLDELAKEYKKNISRRDKKIILYRKINAISKSSSGDLFLGVITYHGYLIGVVLKGYHDYESLDSIYDELSDEEIETIFSKVNIKIEELMNENIYPFDLKEDHIFVRREDMDVKLIDLDDEQTIHDIEDNAFMKRLERKKMEEKQEKVKSSIKYKKMIKKRVK